MRASKIPRVTIFIQIKLSSQFSPFVLPIKGGILHDELNNILSRYGVL